MTPQDLQRLILKLISQNNGPIGQGTLTFLLRQQGVNVSVPTVGRKLQALEFAGLLRKVSVDGRSLTPSGREMLDRWDAEARLRGSGEALLQILRRSDRKHILDLLDARRILEGETAALAAHRATPRQIRRMEILVRAQAADVERGGLGIEEDVSFHREIAKASHNVVLLRLVPLLRQHARYNVVIASIRSVVGGRMVVDHRAILEAIRAQDPNAAKDRMIEHLTGVAEDVKQYWEHVAGIRRTPLRR